MVEFIRMRHREATNGSFYFSLQPDFHANDENIIFETSCRHVDDKDISLSVVVGRPATHCVLIIY